tara:strand:+ start:4987 stop:5415 length:429 start_codon:yes stop_codon:yes gene_type:complete
MSFRESLGFWELPEPNDDKNKRKWLPIPRSTSVIPFGYMVCPNDNSLLLPIDLELDALEKAKLHLKQYSYREVARWLEKTTGRYISHVGLTKRIKDEKKRKGTAKIKRQWVKRYEKALKTVERLEKGRLGAHDKIEDCTNTE